MSADSTLEAIAQDIAAHREPGAVLVVGITGAIAAGKSTFAEQLGAQLHAMAQTVEIVCTDGFLMPNDKLTELGLLDTKGFPPSYDNAALSHALTSVRTGPADFPAYSHVTYDIDPTLTRTLATPDILIVEGLNLHHRAANPDAPDPLDLLIYIDADEADLEAWYLARFMDLWAAAEHDPTSFYARFRGMTEAQTEDLARMVWTQVNLKNLHDHIAQAKPTADMIVRKGGDHAIEAIVRGRS